MKCLFVVVLVLAVTAGAEVCGQPGRALDVEHFWQARLSEMAACPADPQVGMTSLTFRGPRFISCRARYHMASQEQGLPPVLYLLDRESSEEATPLSNHAWIALNLRQCQYDAGSPDPTRQPEVDAILCAIRALRILLSMSRGSVAGIVGEGRGAGAGMAVAALCQAQTAFLCVNSPLPTAAVTEVAPYVNPVELARLVRAPSLVGVSPGDPSVAPAYGLIVYDNLKGEKDLVEFQEGRHCRARELQWRHAWQEWTGAVLGLR